MVILVAVVTFGLSMDYEVFLLSRIKEEHDAGRSNVEAVATGLQRSARIITAAALLLAIVFAAFLTSGVTSIKTLGFGVAFAILVDASIVRGLLVPALMRLFGERNWWAPRWMKRFSITH
jgi:RND superfamily putative drug exporter